jgi:Pentapeptide repeats (8 copies)
MKNTGIRLIGVLSLLVLSVTIVPAGLVRANPGQQNPTQSPAAGTWTDTNVQYINQVQQGSDIDVTSIVCGTVSGTISGTYCAYGYTVLNLNTGIANYISADVCACDQTGQSGSLTFLEQGSLTPTASGLYLLQSSESIVKESNVYVPSSTLHLSGYLNPVTDLSWGSYTGTAQLSVGPGANLQSANLSGLNLAGFNLAGDNLQSANLAGTNLGGANLQGADLKSANLAGATLTGLSSKQPTNLGGANLQQAILTGAICGSPNYIVASGVNMQNAVGVPSACSPPL